MTSDPATFARHARGAGLVPVAVPEDAFASYAASKAPKPRQPRPKTPRQEAVDAVRAERKHLAKTYAAMRGHHIARTLALFDPQGRLAPFLETLRELSIEQAPILVEAIESAGWLVHADLELRFLALQEIDHIIVKIREKAGLVPFDDPISEADTNAFFQVKRLLRL